MEIYLAEQTKAFFLAVLLGASLGLFYDVFRILRIAFPTKRGVVFVQDLLYWIVCALCSFLFLLTSSDGVVRVFLLVGELIGAVLYHCTLGLLVMKVAQKIIAAIKAVLRFLFRYLFRPIWRVFYAIVSFLLRPMRFLGRIVKKFLRKLRFRLKVGRVVVYNQLTGRVRRLARFVDKTQPQQTNGENCKYVPDGIEETQGYKDA